VVKAIMLEERAALSEWEPLQAMLRHSQGLLGSWSSKVRALRGKYQIPAFDREAARGAPSADAVRARLSKFRKEKVEPRIFEEAEEEIARERARPENTLYSMLHPGRGPVADVLEGHEWGMQTLSDYRAWSRLRMFLRVPGACPVCGNEDGSAEHILGAHAVPRFPLPEADDGEGMLWYLRTDLAAAVMRRNIRLVGQLLRNGADWGWLRAAQRATLLEEEHGAGAEPGAAGTEAGPGEADVSAGEP
jgi:hypothetical protein